MRGCRSFTTTLCVAMVVLTSLLRECFAQKKFLSTKTRSFLQGATGAAASRQLGYNDMESQVKGGKNAPECPAGHRDQTNGRAHWWACGGGCPGGAFTDSCCNCACILKDDWTNYCEARIPAKEDNKVDTTTKRWQWNYRQSSSTSTTVSTTRSSPPTTTITTVARASEDTEAEVTTSEPSSSGSSGSGARSSPSQIRSGAFATSATSSGSSTPSSHRDQGTREPPNSYLVNWNSKTFKILAWTIGVCLVAALLAIVAHCSQYCYCFPQAPPNLTRHKPSRVHPEVVVETPVPMFKVTNPRVQPPRSDPPVIKIDGKTVSHRVASPRPSEVSTRSPSPRPPPSARSTITASSSTFSPSPSPSLRVTATASTTPSPRVWLSPRGATPASSVTVTPRSLTAQQPNIPSKHDGSSLYRHQLQIPARHNDARARSLSPRHRVSA